MIPPLFLHAWTWSVIGGFSLAGFLALGGLTWQWDVRPTLVVLATLVAVTGLFCPPDVAWGVSGTSAGLVATVGLVELWRALRPT